MYTAKHDWLVFFWARFPRIVDVTNQSFEAPALADFWCFGPENSSVNDMGLVDFRSDSWGGFALYRDGETAEAVVSAPRDNLPFLADTVEAWCGLLLPKLTEGMSTGAATSSLIARSELPMSIQAGHCLL